MDTNTPTPASTPPPPATSGEDKTVAILAYLTLIGFIVAIIMHSSKKTKLGAYHLRQVLGFALTGIVGGFVVGFVIAILALVLSFMKSIVLLIIPLLWFAFVIAFIALWVMGFIAALNGQMKPMPIVGPLYQKWFGNTFE